MYIRFPTKKAGARKRMMRVCGSSPTLVQTMAIEQTSRNQIQIGRLYAPAAHSPARVR
jgi:hypothetical protein